jgi:hypothetical protein
MQQGNDNNVIDESGFGLYRSNWRVLLKNPVLCAYLQSQATTRKLLEPRFVMNRLLAVTGDEEEAWLAALQQLEKDRQFLPCPPEILKWLDVA